MKKFLLSFCISLLSLFIFVRFSSASYNFNGWNDGGTVYYLNKQQITVTTSQETETGDIFCGTILGDNSDVDYSKDSMNFNLIFAGYNYYIADSNTDLQQGILDISSGNQNYSLDCTNGEIKHNNSLIYTFDPVGTYESVMVAKSRASNISSVTCNWGESCVSNFFPTVGTIIVSNMTVQINSSIIASASFSDQESNNTHTASWNWGDGNTTNGTVTETNGSGTVSNSHTYTTAGAYQIALTVTDNDSGQGVAQYQYVAVYDPSSGFLTGSGKYTSQTGWDMQDAQATGDVKFRISAHYQAGDTVPTGQSKINFKIGNLDFSGSTFQWLVVSGSKATVKGNGTINGSGNYTILISGIDESQTGGNSLVRVKITDSSDTVIYDTQPNASDTADPTTALTSGVIKVH